jgi:hypothetical protein
LKNRDANGTQRDWVLNLYVVKSYGLKWLFFEKWSLITYGEQNKQKKSFPLSGLVFGKYLSATTAFWFGVRKVSLTAREKTLSTAFSAFDRLREVACLEPIIFR